MATRSLCRPARRAYSALLRSGAAANEYPSRSGGKPGDALWLVGTLGDAAAGLAALQADEQAEGTLVEAYRRPVPQLAVGRLLAPHANAMMDVSDGLLLDAARLCAASKCSAAIDLDSLPLSPGLTSPSEAADRRARLAAATGGDDYALLAALPAGFDPLGISLPSGTILARIGTLAQGEGVKLFDRAGEVPLPERLGYEHRA